MTYGELYIPPEPKAYNVKTGRFMKGHVPHNKGKKWSDYMSKKAQRRAAKDGKISKNIVLLHVQTPQDAAGRKWLPWKITAHGIIFHA